jgi:ATP-binding cassette, subfamily B, beta-glucan exporter
VMKGRTTFVIAHRLATIRHASRILVFEGGRVIESGTFDELMQLGGHFAQLARSQFMASDTNRAESERARSEKMNAPLPVGS